MSRVMITGSTEGLGLMAGQLLIGQGHQVTAHARNAQRAEDARRALPSAEAIVVGDLSTIHGMHQAASQANQLGRFDAVIHNAGAGSLDQSRTQTPDGLSRTFAVNVLAPYVLTMTMVSGRYFYHHREREASALASRHGLQEQLLAYCAKLSGVPEPRPEK